MARFDVDPGSHPINCRESVWLVSQLRDGELTTQETLMLTRHVQECPRCQTARSQFESLHAGLDELLARPQAPEPDAASACGVDADKG